MKSQTIVIALTAALLAVSSTASAQVHEVGHWLGISSDVSLTVPGLAGEHPAKVVAPRNLLEQIRGGTLRELELDVPPGSLRNALARSGRTGGAVGTVRLKVRDQTGAVGWIELQSVQCGTCPGTGAAAAQGRVGRVKLQFPSITTATTASGAAPTPGPMKWPDITLKKGIDPGPAAQSGSVAAPAVSRVALKTQRVPIRVADGRTGWVEFDLSGDVGGRAAGRITLLLGSRRDRGVRTEYQVSNGSLRHNQSGYEFLVQGAARSAGGAAARPFSSRLTLKAAGRGGRTPYIPTGGIAHSDNWREQAMAAGDVWVIDGLTCEWNGKDLVCL